MKKIIFKILILLTLIIIPGNVQAKEDITIYIFRGNSCPHCEEALKYLNEHKDELPKDVKIITYETWAKTTTGKNNAKLLEKIGKRFDFQENNIGSVPLFVVGDSYNLGYSSVADITKVLNLVDKYKNGEEEYHDIVAEEIKDSGIEAKSMSLSQVFPEPNKVVTIIVYCVFGVIVLGFGAMIIFSRKG